VADERSARVKLAALHRLRGSMDSALVAFSGGADSAFLAFMARQVLGSKAVAVTADSASLARSELRDAAAVAAEFGLRHQVAATTELPHEAYVRNSGDRCYFCKNALMQALEAIRAEAGYKAEILVGVNTDDLGDYRPGQQAVGERGGRWPLVEVGCLRPRSAGCPSNSACPRGTSLPPGYQQGSHNLTLQRRPSREQRDDFGSENRARENCSQPTGEGEERHEDRWY
jgi:hypothetical protein